MLARLLLLFPDRIEASLDRVESAGIVPCTPNSWQIALGIARMWHRVFFRSEGIGMSQSHSVRPTWRARLFRHRAVRFPFLVAERAVAPLDFSGLASSPERVIRHILGAYHDGNRFAYDLSILLLYPGKTEELLERARAVVDGTDPRAEWLRDLVVFEDYHERVLASTERALARGVEIPADEECDPDTAFTGYLRWCAAQPETYEATREAMARGEYTIANGWTRASEALVAEERHEAGVELPMIEVVAQAG